MHCSALTIPSPTPGCPLALRQGVGEQEWCRAAEKKVRLRLSGSSTCLCFPGATAGKIISLQMPYILTDKPLYCVAAVILYVCEYLCFQVQNNLMYFAQEIPDPTLTT